MSFAPTDVQEMSPDTAYKYASENGIALKLGSRWRSRKPYWTVGMERQATVRFRCRAQKHYQRAKNMDLQQELAGAGTIRCRYRSRTDRNHSSLTSDRDELDTDTKPCGFLTKTITVPA